jgi:hypothetical protein
MLGIRVICEGLSNPTELFPQLFPQSVSQINLILKIKMQNSTCESCGGSGQEVIGVHLVTRDMAIDAGDPSLEGTFHSDVYEGCTSCGGTGVVPTEHLCRSGLAPHDYATDDQGDQVDLKCRNCGHVKS